MDNQQITIVFLLSLSAFISFLTFLVCRSRVRYMRERHSAIMAEWEMLIREFPEAKTLREAIEMCNKKRNVPIESVSPPNDFLDLQKASEIYRDKIQDLSKDPNAIYSVQSYVDSKQGTTFDKIKEAHKEIRFILYEQRNPTEVCGMLRSMEWKALIAGRLDVDVSTLTIDVKTEDDARILHTFGLPYKTGLPAFLNSFETGKRALYNNLSESIPFKIDWEGLNTSS